MTEDRFRLPGSSYEELTKIIKAYGDLDKEVTPGDVSKVAGGIHPTIVSRNNAFLVGIGVIEGGKKKRITEQGRNLARALEHEEEMPDEISRLWRETVLANEFLQKLLSAVRIRKGMEPSTLQAHVVYSAGEPKKQIVMTGAGAVIDILKVASLVKEEEGGKLVVVSEPIGTEEQPTFARQTTRQEELAARPVAALKIPAVGIAEGVAVAIQIQIQCSAAEIDNLAPKLRALLKELSSPGVSAQSGDGE